MEAAGSQQGGARRSEPQRNTTANQLSGEKDDYHGQQQNCGMLCGQRQSASQPNREQPQQAGRFYPAIQAIDAGQEETRYGCIGCNKGTVGKDGRFKDDQSQGDQPCYRTKHLPAGQKREQGKQQNEDRHAHTGTEDDGICRAAATVTRAVVEDQLPAIIVGFVFEITALKRRHTQSQGHEQQRRDHLHQRRVLWVEAVIVGLERHIAGKDMVALIPAQRLAPNGEDNLGRHNQQQRKHRRNRPYPSFQPESPFFVNCGSAQIASASDAALEFDPRAPRFPGPR
jgi:hypothetical protein